MSVGSLDPFACLIGNQIRSDQSGSAGVFEIACEALDAVMVDEVPVAHHQRHSAGVRHGFNRFEHIGDLLAVVDGDLGSRLDDGTVHDRIGIWETDFDGIDAMLHHRAECLQRIFRIREAIRKVADERRFVSRFEPIEHGLAWAWLVADAQRLTGRRVCCSFVRHNDRSSLPTRHRRCCLGHRWLPRPWPARRSGNRTTCRRCSCPCRLDRRC